MNNKIYLINGSRNTKKASASDGCSSIPCIKNTLIILTLLIMTMCTAEVEKETPKPLPPLSPLHQENENSDSIILSWNLPAQKPDSVASYEVWYHTEKNFNPVFLKNVTASSKPYVVIHRNEVASTDSVFYFLVRSVLKSGDKSEYHISSDSSAIPSGGWLVRWK